MSAPGETVAVVINERAHRIEWAAVFGGAVIASGISFALLAFGSGIGLSVMSASPTWHASSPWLWLLSGLYLVFTALCSFGFGGYVAGRMRAPLTGTVLAEMEYRDGMHGVLTWGLAIVFTAMLAVGGAAAIAPAAATNGNPASAMSVAGESILASELDQLFRSDRRMTNAGDLTYRRAEASRILLTASSDKSVSDEDRNYLTDVVAAQTGLSATAASARTDQVIVEARQTVHRARQAAVLQAFLIAAALFLGAAIAWFAACEGGRDREARTYPSLAWSRRHRSA